MAVNSAPDMTRRMEPEIPHRGLRRTVRFVALLNLAYFGIEFAAARAIGSVSLFADSIDFLEDASVSFLVIVAIGWTARSRGGSYGAGRYPSRSGYGDSVDGVGKIGSTRRSRRCDAGIDRGGGAGRQSGLRPYAG